jgi:hypothetical protein
MGKKQKTTCTECGKRVAWREGLCNSCHIERRVAEASGRPLVEVPLEQLQAEGEAQARERLDPDKVEEYGAVLAASPGVVWKDPAVVFFDGEWYWLGDGFHRAAAYIDAKKDTMPCDVRPGTREDARWFACGANKTHGLHRTNADKRKAVRMALEQKPQMSDRAIAEHCGVSPPFVASIRRESEGGLTENGLQSDDRVGLDGRTTDTSNIGRRPDEPTPPVEPDPADPPPGKGDAWLPEEDEEPGTQLHQPPGGATEPDPEPQPDEYLRDGVGLLVPDHLARVFQDAPDVLAIARLLETAERRIESLAAAPAGVHLQRRIIDQMPGEKGPLMPVLRRIIAEVHNCVPHAALCLRCRYGPPMEEGKVCPECAGLLWTPKPYWVRGYEPWKAQAISEEGPLGKPYDASVGPQGASAEVKALDALGRLTKFLPEDIYRRVKSSLEQIGALLRREAA